MVLEMCASTHTYKLHFLSFRHVPSLPQHNIIHHDHGIITIYSTPRGSAVRRVDDCAEDSYINTMTSLSAATVPVYSLPGNFDWPVS